MAAGDLYGLLCVAVAGTVSLLAGRRRNGRLSIAMGALALVGALLVAVPKRLPTSAPAALSARAPVAPPAPGPARAQEIATAPR